MSVLSEALEFLGLAGGSDASAGRYELRMARTRNEQRELAEAMRRLPGRFATRLSAQTMEQVRGAAAAGRWEQAVDELIIALQARAGTVTDQERQELRAVLQALRMPTERVEALLPR
jgi:thioredoxin-like negative regulator of GroEL